jgi:tetratricopeptide (TPR) repeat protein
MAPVRRSGKLAVAAFFLACASPVLAREDDPEFALALADRGYEALAKQEAEQIRVKAKTQDERENAEYTMCLLLRRAALLAAANDKSDPKDVRAKFGAASLAFDHFLKGYPNSKRKGEAEFHMANLMKDFAYYLTNSKDKFEAKERDGVVVEANKTFDEAIKYLTTIRDREEQKAQADSSGAQDEEKFFERNKAWYFLCVAMHDRAMLHPEGDPLRIQQLTQSIEETTRFLEQTDGMGIFGYLAGWWLGQEYWHRAKQVASGGAAGASASWSAEDLKQAREWFSGPIDICDFQNVEQDWPTAVDVSFQAAQSYGQMCNEVGVVEGVNYPKLFVEKAAHMEEKLPSIRTERYGLLTLVEKARAMARIGMAEAAVLLLNQVSNWGQAADPTWGRAVDQMAKRGLNDVLADIPPDSPLQLGPEVLMKAGDGSFRDGNFGRAIRAYQRVLVACENDPDPERRKSLAAQYWEPCWLNLNECYMNLSRYLEAYYAADCPVQQFLAGGGSSPSDDMRNLALYRVTALEALLKNLPKDAPKDVRDELVDRVKKARELLEKVGVATYAYTMAVGKLNAASALMNGGDVQRGTDKFKEAIDGFKAVEAKDDNYLLSIARIGECLVLMKKPEDAVKHLDTFIAAHLKEWTDSGTPARLKQPWGWAVFWRAKALDAVNQPAKVLEALQGFESTFKDANLDSTIPQARFLRAVALVKTGKGDDACKEVDAMRQGKESAYTPLGCLFVANDLKARADKAAGTGDHKAEVALKTRAVDYYEFWLRRADNVDPERYTFLGQLHEDIGNHDRAAELWQKALDLYEKAGNREKADNVTIWLAGLLVGQGRYAEALPKFEALFVRTPADVQPLRDCMEALRKRPVNVAQPVHEKRVKEILETVAAELAKDPAGAAASGEAKRAAAGLDIEILIRAYADTPDLRRALARASALTILGHDASMTQELKVAVFNLVKRSPDLMSNLARCYEELWKAAPENPLRATNLYSTLVEAAPDPEGGAPVPGSKYSERWFDWKLRWARVALFVGKEYNHEGWLRITCDIVKGMTTLNELERAKAMRPEFDKEFLNLKDQADAALRGLGKEGCK